MHRWVALFLSVALLASTTGPLQLFVCLMDGSVHTERCCPAEPERSPTAAPIAEPCCEAAHAGATWIAKKPSRDTIVSADAPVTAPSATILRSPHALKWTSSQVEVRSRAGPVYLRHRALLI